MTSNQVCAIKSAVKATQEAKTRELLADLEARAVEFRNVPQVREVFEAVVKIRKSISSC